MKMEDTTHQHVPGKAASGPADEVVRIWVRGHYMELNPEFVKSRDWVLAKALTSDVPWSRDPAGALLVDCDPEAFRSVVELLKGTVTLQEFIGNLSELQHALMASTCEYLCCADLAEAFRSNEEQLCVLKEHAQDGINRAEGAENKLRQMREEMNAPLVEKNLLAYKLTCKAHRSYRPSNQCGRVVLTTSPGGEGFATRLECTDCKSCDNWTMEVLGSFQEVKECMETIANQNSTDGIINISKSEASALLRKQNLNFKVV